MKSESTNKSKTKPTSKYGHASISKARTLIEQAEFWDTHDSAAYPAEWVEFEIDVRARQHYVAIEPEMLSKIRGEAYARGLSTESLINLWLQERLTATTPRPS